MKYACGKCSIKFDPERTTGRYYASIQLSSSRVNFRPEMWLEITLNGDGKSKARKKIRRELASRNINAEYFFFEDEKTYP
ncbi:MAG: hypothetical protein HYW27_00765 [Candidatus Aenigmarchaeota archaeon]|nr:hypothetical protein [Candidatus Aenigmarchaeota archaeon]